MATLKKLALGLIVMTSALAAQTLRADEFACAETPTDRDATHAAPIFELCINEKNAIIFALDRGSFKVKPYFYRTIYNAKTKNIQLMPIEKEGCPSCESGRRFLRMIDFDDNFTVRDLVESEAVVELIGHPLRDDSGKITGELTFFGKQFEAMRDGLMMKLGLFKPKQQEMPALN